jgi:hypothetical protein
MVEGILRNRLGEQQLQFQQSQDLAKAIQAQRQDAAFGEQASNAGLLPGVDTSNMSAAQIALLAQRIQQQGSEASLNEYRQKLGEAATTRADRPSGGGRGGGGDTISIYADDGTYLGEAPINSVVARNYLASHNPNLGTQTSPSTAASVAGKMGLTPQSLTDTSGHQGMAYAPGSVDQQGNTTDYLPVSPGDEPTDIKVTPKGTNPATGQPYAPQIIQKDTLERLRRALQGPSYQPPSQQTDVTYPPTVVDPKTNVARLVGDTSATGGPAPSPTPRTMPNASTGAPVNVPKFGDVVNGYAFQGGDPNDPKNWTPAGQP